MSDQLNLPREQFESVIFQPMALDALGTELTICFQDLKGPCEIKTCYGDICKIVNALRDYARMLRMVCEEWNLQGYHQAVYELHADILEKISKKYQAGIGYDYDKAIEKCRKRAAKKSRDDDVGGEAMAMAYLKAQRTAAAKDKAESDDTASDQKALPGNKPEPAALEAIEVGHYDFLDGSMFFLVDITGVPLSIQTEAWQIDGENFNQNCFGVCVNYDFGSCQFSISTDKAEGTSGNLYYIDSGGGKHWFTVEMAASFLKQAFLMCVEAAANADCEQKPTKREAVQSVTIAAYGR